MADNTGTPEQHTISQLQEAKILLEIEILQLEKDAKIRQKKSRPFFKPEYLSIFLAIITLCITNVVSIYLQKKQQDKADLLEKEKHVYSIFEKASEAKSRLATAQILDFYISIGQLDGERNHYTKLILKDSLNAVPNINESFSYQFVKPGFSVQFSDINIKLKSYDKQFTAGYFNLYHAGKPYFPDMTIDSNIKISVNNLHGFSYGNFQYSLFLDSIRTGYGPQKNNPAAFVRLSKKNTN